ncbi:MAG: multiheme c-type cytochrome [Rhodobacter sp.]|nr:multiheme c-type cytochrome [Rhodobacter sp.]
MLKSLVAFTAATLVAALSASAQTAQEDEAEYAGAETCKACHLEIYEDYARSGHPWKIHKVDGAAPTYPEGTSPGVWSPPADLEWADISYVIGGYGWKARFMDLEGYILTGDQNRQYNLANETLGLAANWTGYSASTAPRKPYTCGTCHTTGWEATGEDGPHQDGLPGIHGTWVETGVTCEACHGPGSAHVANPAEVDLSVAPNCNACHIRGDVTQIDASNGLVRHHEQYEDLLASPHNALGCGACHDPHKGTKYDLGGFKGQEATCNACHKEQAPVAVAAEAHSDCTSCHMPFAGKSAVATAITYQGGSVPKGDIRSHIHRIATDPGWNMFTEDGKFVATDDQNRAFLTVDFTCLSCHQDKDTGWALAVAPLIHGQR